MLENPGCYMELGHISSFERRVLQPLRELEVTMVVSSRTLELMSYVINLELDINSQPSILLNQMG